MLLTLPATADTEVLGSVLADRIPPLSNATMVVHFHGEIGAGKTTCIRSFLRARGVKGTIRSPTYTLIESYSAPPLWCVHADLYRLQSVRETEELGFRDLPEREAVMLIEWPERGGSAVPPADLILHFEYAGESRRVRAAAASVLAASWLADLRIDTRLASYVSNLT
jgi:tRNA threonylcarbamoyladenosine biosynthesis protein TsaE